MQAYESGDERGLIYGYVLNGRGGGRRVGRNQIAVLDLLPEESLWLHWDRGVPEAQAWLRDSGAQRVRLRSAAGGGDSPPFARSRAESLLVFLRGVNLNPGAEPEDMVSRGIRRRAPVISLSLRPLKAVADLLEDLEAGKGPKTASEVVYYLAHYLTDRVDTLISGIADQLDAVEELVEADERASPDQHQLRTLRRRSAGCGATWRRSGISTRNWRATSCPGSSRTTPITGTS